MQTLQTLNQTRAKRRALARRGVAPEPIEIPARQTPPVQLPEGVDPLLDAARVCFFLGGISPMSLHRWTGKRNFPLPDLRIGQRRFWRLSSVERWIQSQIACFSIIIGIILAGVAGFGPAALFQALQVSLGGCFVNNNDDIYRAWRLYETWPEIFGAHQKSLAYDAFRRIAVSRVPDKAALRAWAEEHQPTQQELRNRINVRDPLRSRAETRVTVGSPALNLRVVTVQGRPAAALGQALPSTDITPTKSDAPPGGVKPCQ